MGAVDRFAGQGVSMTVELLNQVAGQALKVTLLVGGPLLLVSLVIGVLISIFQAITQLQEMTLTFVPKIIAVFLAVFLTLPWMTSVLMDFTTRLFENIPMYIN